jgi:hypothetical protein
MVELVLQGLTNGLGMELVVGALAVTGAYFLGCLVWPYEACTRCKGKGRFRSPSGRAWRACGKCKGKGSRIRWGRRVWGRFSGRKH